MKAFIVFCIILTACSGERKGRLPDSPDDYTGPIMIAGQPLRSTSLRYDNTHSPKDCYQRTSLFENIHKSAFVGASGEATSWSKTIADCTLIEGLTSHCSLAKLDFIKPASGSPDIDDILDRVIVSEPWMAKNFRFLINKMPSDLLQLFSSITAIIIHPNIAMGFFLPATGGLYLSADYVTLNANDIQRPKKIKPDCHSASQLGFHYITRYVKNGELVFFDMNTIMHSSHTTPVTEKSEHLDTQNATYRLASLLYHELAHARDYFPDSLLIHRPDFATPDYLRVSSKHSITSMLYAYYPLSDTTGILPELAGILYHHKPLKQPFFDLPIDDITGLFSMNHANDMYSYSNNTEDMALLFETFMMKYHFNVDREIAFTQKLYDSALACDNLLFLWQDSNRHLNEGIFERAALVSSLMLPEVDLTAYIAEPPQKATFSWCQ